MKNNGTMPDHESVDIKFRNGVVKRSVNPKQWRWHAWPDEHDYDIVSWQVSKG